jgi:protein phosphatase-4 regulatory subunit 3
VYLHKDNGWEEICIAFIQIVHGEGVSFIRGILQQQIQANKSLVTFAHLNVNKEEWCVNLKVSSENQYEKHGDNII